ncbi:MAG: ribose ABC transporter substrate-binding protein RbsB [Caldiserica bacterium]|jgi:ribose transport system substrate-binding protein|nr:ribose ABC transporter substrate-binding protein RbsB [Caldisericota bacterium]
MKKFLILALSLVLIGGLLASCAPSQPSPSPTTTSPSPTPTAKKITLGLVLSTLNNPFFVTLRDGAQAEANKLGVTLIVMDSQNDSAKEASNIEDLISRKVDAILVNPTDADAVVPSIKKANDAKIPVFTIDRGANGGVIVSHIASDNVAGGKMAGEYLAKALNGKGKVVELEGIAGTSAARDRGQGFNEVMKNYPDIQIVARQTADFDRAKGLSVFENILTAQPEINGVFAHNDEMVLGAIQAAEAAGRTGIIFVGFDAIDDAIKAVKDGKLAATVQQQPALMGQLGVQTAVDYLNGKTVEKYIPVPLKLITKENAP